MATAFQSSQRHRQHSARRAPDEAEQAPLDREVLHAAEQDRVLLFGSPSSSTREEWVAPSHARPTALKQRASDSSDSSASSFPSPIANMNSSLFPTHNSGNFTMSDSLVLSEAPSIYASAAELNRISHSTDSDDFPTTSSNRSTGEEARTTRGGAQDDSDFSQLSRPSFSGSDGSWALTEEAVLSLPRAMPTVPRPSSATFTSDSSEDESLAGPSTTPRRSRLFSRKSKQDVRMESDEDFAGTPVAPGGLARRSAVSGKSRDDKENDSRSTSSRDSYPTPPPESLLRKSKPNKRRHRTSGRLGGSQKRSSASGSVVNEPRLEGGSSAIDEEMGKPGEAIMRLRREASERKQVENQVFLGGFLGKLTDLETLQLIADSPTPPSHTPRSPSYSRSPSRSLAAAYPTRSNEPHGFRKFSLEARAQLDFQPPPDSIMYEQEEDSGEETEKELTAMGSAEGAWYKDQQRQLRKSAVEQFSPVKSRSISLASLPFYLLDVLNPLSSYSSTPTLAESTAEHTLSPPISDQPLRRSNSHTSSSRYSGSGSGGRTQRVERRQTESDGLEAAIGYWRRILRSLRGYQEG